VPGSSPDFGFVSEEIGVLKIGGVTLALQTGRNNDGRVLSPTGDLRLHEIDAAFLAAALATTSAKLVNATTVTYDDIDGDHVTVRLSKPLLTAGNVNTVFTFNTGAVNDGVLARQQLQLIDLTDLAAAGVSVTVTVVRGGGDRLANVGAILADEDLGTITLPGDLGQIEAGDATVATRGLAALNVRTLGRLGLDTQPAGSATFTPFLGGDILGALGALTVKQDLAGASLAIGGALGPVTIGGSLIGGSAAASGAISTVQGIGAVKIGQHVQVGTAGNSGFIDAGTSIASLTVGGSIIGGSVNADGTTLGTVTVAHNVLGSLSANTGVGNVTIAGSVLGGTGLSSGRIFAAAGGIGAVSIGHNLRGGSGDESGKIDSAGQLASVTIRGSLLGGSGDYDTTTPAHSGQIVAVGAMGAITIGHNVQGGDGEHSAGIESGGTLTRLTVGGSLAGGAGFFSGNALAEVLAAVKIGRNLLGGSGGGAGYLEGFTSLGAVEVGGSLVGGTGTFDGAIYTGGSLGAVKIGHDVHGGTAGDAGGIKAETSIASVSIGGSLLGGSALRTGAIRGGDIGPVKIGRDLLGGSIAGMTGNLDATGYLESTGRLASVNIGGSIIAGSDDSTGGALTKNASIRAGKDLGALVVKGSLIGNVTANGATPVILSARGEAAPTATRDLAIGKINIGGSVERTLILAGYTTAVVASDTLAAHANNKAQIGAVNVGRDWSASSLVAGILNLGNGFGDGNDVLGLLGGSSDTIARIASVVIGGTVIGSAAPGLDHFGFSSVRIGSFKSLNFTAPLTASTTPDVIELSPITGDVTIREV
jgi:hypothetical protein